jgi:AraC family transcriptional regulator
MFQSQPVQHETFILWETAYQHHWSGVGGLSIKTFRGGRALYQVEGGLHAPEGDAYLLLNAGQDYTVTVDAPTRTESFCVFFGDVLVSDIYQNARQSTENLLALPIAPDATTHFYERLYPHDRLVSPVLTILHESIKHNRLDNNSRDELLHTLLWNLLRQHVKVRHDVDALPMIRAATRDELYRRLYRTRDYICAALDQPLTLDDMAQVALLSPNHLLRSFKALFGQSPYQFLKTQRFERAKKLLLCTSFTVTDIALQAGFTSLSTFSWIFRQYTGFSPEQFRQQNR